MTPKPFRFRVYMEDIDGKRTSKLVECMECDIAGGLRVIETTDSIYPISGRDVARAAEWMARAAKWCAEGRER